MSESPQLYIYTTEGCHLCDVAVGLLVELVNPAELYIELIDIAEVDNSDEMIAGYGERIPVFSVGHAESELQWPFDTEQLFTWLKTHGLLSPCE